jgi:hypothetical protein
VLWRAVADVEHWPEWTATINEVTWLTAAAAGLEPDGDDSPLQPGGRARIRQPRMPDLVWEVTEVRPGVSFTWQARMAGVTATGTHEVRPRAGDRAELILGLAQSGPLAGVAGLLTGRRTRQSVQQEAEGLKRCAEVAASTPGRG